MFYNGGFVVGWPIPRVWLWTTFTAAAPFLVFGGIVAGGTRLLLEAADRPESVVSVAKVSPHQPVTNDSSLLQTEVHEDCLRHDTRAAMFWVSVFVYGPLYITEAGLNPAISGAMLSAVAALLLLAPIIRKGAERYGTRALARSGFLLIGVSMVGLGLLGEPRGLGLLSGSSRRSARPWIDVVGNIPFMRPCETRERVPMATVFSPGARSRVHRSSHCCSGAGRECTVRKSSTY